MRHVYANIWNEVSREGKGVKDGNLSKLQKRVACVIESWSSIVSDEIGNSEPNLNMEIFLLVDFRTCLFMSVLVVHFISIFFIVETRFPVNQL